LVEGSSFAPLMAPLAERLKRLKAAAGTVAVAESATGGLLGAVMTDLPGASEVFVGGFITYTYAAKERLLGIPRDLLERKGAVDAEVARLMAEGSRMQLAATLGLAVTGVAGPDPQEGKEVGLMYVAAAVAGRTEVREHHFGPGRASNRIAAVEAAISLGLEVLGPEQPPGQQQQRGQQQEDQRRPAGGSAGVGEARDGARGH
jgi:PncC family amidohydrolase